MSAVQTTAPVEAFTADVIRNAVVAITRAMKTNLMRTPYSSIIALVGFQGRRCVDGVQPDFCLSLLLPLNLSYFVARKIWRRRGISPRHGRAHRLQRREPRRRLLMLIDTTFDLLQTARN